MSDKVLIYNETQVPFEANSIKQAFRKLECVSQIRATPEVVAAVEADYESGTGSCIIRLISSCKMISIEGSLETTAEVVFALKDVLNQSLHVIDEGYTFDLAVGEMESAKEVLAELLAAAE